MTNEQYERWRDFALRMAKTCFAYLRNRPSKTWVIEQVESWFCWRNYQKDWSEYNSWDQDANPLCDHVVEFYDDLIPGFVCCACRQSVWDLDYDDTLICRCDECDEKGYDQYSEQWLGPIECCLRAGIDFACEPSSGVIGFTVGDLRRMYPEGVPDWVSGGDEKWCPWLRKHEESECRTLSEMPDSQGVVL